MNWRRILLLSIALVSVIGIATWALLQNSDVATEFVRRRLNQVFASPVSIESTSIHLEGGRLSIRDFRLADPNQDASRPRDLVHIENAHVDAAADPFGKGVQLRHVVVEGLTIECGPTMPTVAQLLNEPTGSDKPGDQEIPVIEIRSGKAVLHLREGVRPLRIEALQMTARPLQENGRLLQIHGTATLAEPAATCRIRGEVDLDRGAWSFALEAAEIACTQKIVEHLCELAGEAKPELQVGGQITSIEVLCEQAGSDDGSPASAEPTPRLRVRANCRDVYADTPDLPAIVRSAKIELTADTANRGPGQHGMIRAVVEQHDDKGDLNVSAQIDNLFGEQPDVELRAKGRNVVVDGNSLAAVRAFPIGLELVEALRPTTGRGDLDLYLKNPHRRDGDAEMDLTMRDGAMSFEGFGTSPERIGFPLRLEQASGRIRLRGNVILLDDMQAKIPESAGGGEVTLVGRIETDKPSGEDVRIDIHGDDIPFHQDLRDALGTLLRDDGELYDRLAPAGRATVHVEMRPRSELPGGFRVDIQPKGATMRWAGFPYQLDNLRGSIRVRSNDCRFDLTGRHGDGGLSMRGRIPLARDYATEDGFEAVIDANQLVLDDDLRSAVATVVPDLLDPWQKASPKGRLSGEIKVWRPQDDDELLHDVRLSLQDVDIDLPMAPWRAIGLNGQVLVQGQGSAARIDFDALRGQLANGIAEPAQLALLGHLESDGSGQSGPGNPCDLAFVVRDLELCEQVGRTQDELGALDFATWKSLRPSGRVDLVCRHQIDAKGDEDLQVIVQLIDVRSQAPMLPKPAEHLSGELHVEGGELTFRDVRGQLGGTTVHCANGRVRQLPENDGRTEISFDVHAKRFPIDDGLANLFSGPLQAAVRDRHMRGQADVDGLRLRFAIPTSDDCQQPFTTTIGGSIGLDGVDMLLGTGRDGIRVANMHGMITLSESTVTEQGGQLVGTFERGSLSLFGHPFEAIEAAFTADADRLLLGTLNTRIHDGSLRNAEAATPALTYLLPAPNVPEGRLAADLSFKGVDVFSLLTTSGWDNAPYSGTASGRATLRRLDGNKVVGAKAEGSLKIERADLGKVPLFKAIYAQLPPADQPRFNQLDLTYRLTEDAIVFDNLDVRSEILAAAGRGKLNLDGYLDVKMKLDNLLGKSGDPLVMPLLNYLTSNLVSFRLYGHLRDLHASTEFAGGSSPKRPEVLPMPPARKKVKTPGY